MKPRFKHDCDFCIYLGQHGIADLYYCPGQDVTVIARYSDEGRDYKSGIAFVGTNPDLSEAGRRALEYLGSRECKTSKVKELTEDKMFDDESGIMGLILNRVNGIDVKTKIIKRIVTRKWGGYPDPRFVDHSKWCCRVFDAMIKHRYIIYTRGKPVELTLKGARVRYKIKAAKQTGVYEQ